MSRRKLAVCVSTSKPSSSLTAGGGGGSIMMLCPHTGAVLSSLRASGDNSSKSSSGKSSLSLFPEHYTSLGPPLMIAYGGTTAKRHDTYGLLLSLRDASCPPLIHWKSRLPEAQLTGGLLVSPCGNYILGGGSSRNLLCVESTRRSALPHRQGPLSFRHGHGMERLRKLFGNWWCGWNGSCLFIVRSRREK